MISCWSDFLSVLPAWIRGDVNRIGKDRLQELRLRLDAPPELNLGQERIWLKNRVRQEDLDFCMNAASSYSPWSRQSVTDGYLTIRGGHRMGICGEGLLQSGAYAGIRSVRSLCIRIAADYPGIGEKAGELQGSILILGAPGWGKTTLLRDLIRIRSRKETVAVLDGRGEIFPEGFDRGLQTDVLTNCPAGRGILQLLRTMGPQTIAVDEITAPEECAALMQAAFCGVSLLATAHSASLEDFKSRPLYRALLEEEIFPNVLILRKDQTYQVERMRP